MIVRIEIEKRKTMKFWKEASIFLFILLLTITVSFADNIKIYLDSDVITNDEKLLCDKKSKLPINGILKEYYKSGELKFESLYKDGKGDGISKKYYKSGGLEIEAPFRDNKLDGIYKGYYESGELEIESLYKDGKLDGISKRYYKSGELKYETPHKDDKLNGTGKYYLKSGFICKEIVYKNNKAISGFIYTENGKKREITNAHLQKINKIIR